MLNVFITLYQILDCHSVCSFALVSCRVTISGTDKQWWTALYVWDYKECFIAHCSRIKPQLSDKWDSILVECIVAIKIRGQASLLAAHLVFHYDGIWLTYMSITRWTEMGRQKKRISNSLFFKCLLSIYMWLVVIRID